MGPRSWPRRTTKRSLFRYFKTSPDIIRLVVMMYVGFPLSLRNVEDLLQERASTSATRGFGSGARGAARCLPPRSAKDVSSGCGIAASGAGTSQRYP